jgi:hypothetical protein
MPNDVKAAVSAAVAIVAIVLAYWSPLAGAAGIRKFPALYGGLHDCRHVDFSRSWREEARVEKRLSARGRGYPEEKR